MHVVICIIICNIGSIPVPLTIFVGVFWAVAFWIGAALQRKENINLKKTYNNEN